jgi:tetratricopeptide (TPR) repeat protein
LSPSTLQLLSNFPTPKLHYLNHLLCIQRRDWQGALDNLHRYFDYCYYGVRRDSGMIASYASLNLASLHYRFGHYDAALQCIQETIRIAHQKNEHECLALALAYLFRLADRSGLRDRSELLMKKCIDRAKELNMPDLFNQTSLAHTKFLALKKKNTTSGDVTDLTRAIWKGIHANIIGDGISDMHRRGNAHTALLATAAMWESLGSPDLAEAYERCVTGDVTIDDYIVSKCNLAEHRAKNGEYKEALQLLTSLSIDSELIHSYRTWPRTAISILLRYHINTSSLTHASVLVKRLFDMRGDTDDQSVDNIIWECDIMNWRGILCLESGNFDEAAEWARKCVELCEKNQVETPLVKYLLFLAQIYLASESPTSALKYLMKGITISTERCLEYYNAIFTLHLADLMLCMNYVEKCQDLIERVSQFIIQNGYVTDRAYMHFVKAKSLSSIDLESTLQHLKQAREEYRKVQDLKRIQECLFMESHVYNDLSRIIERDRASEECLEIKELCKNRSNQQYIGMDDTKIDSNDNIAWVYDQMKYIVNVIE